MTLNQLFLPIQKTLNICPAGWPKISTVAGSRRTNQVPLALPIHTANQSPTGQARAPHQFPACHGPAFPDCASLFENLKNVQNKFPLSIEQGSGISRHLRKYMITVFTDGSFFCKMQTGNVHVQWFCLSPFSGRHPEAAFFIPR